MCTILTQGWVELAIVKVASLVVVPPVRWEWNSISASSLNCKRGNKDQSFRSARNSCCQEEIVLQEPVGVVFSDVQLNEESHGEENSD